MMTTSRIIRLAAAAVLLAPSVARAQGSISVLGFGYPNGQLSTRALGAGGATGEMDPLSATNPAVIGTFGGSVLYFQLEPEYRTLHVGGNTEHATIARYPITLAAWPFSQQWVVGVSASNLLDRSFQTQVRGSQFVGDTVLTSTNTFKSDGAIGDLRLAVAYMPNSWLRFGVAAHAITGDNRVRSTQVFDDSLRFAALVDTATLGYSGNAWSAGFEAVPGGIVSLAGSYRHGNSLSLKRGDTTIAKGSVPDRLALSLAYVGIRGTTIAVRTAHDTWSRMEPLGTPDLRAVDTWDTSVGADVLGPRFANSALQLRAGARWRTLPFALPTSDVAEKTYSFGVGTTLGRGGRAALDITTFRSSRSAGPSLDETAWTLSVGLTVRP